MELTTEALREMWDRQDDDMVDKLGYIGMLDSDLLAAAARGDVDLNEIARWNMASRGLGRHGEWVGFPEAKRIWMGDGRTYPVDNGNGRRVRVTIPQS